MQDQIFNTFWYGTELPPLQWACLSSFVQRGQTLRVFGYQKFEVPKGVFLEDARQIISERELFEFEESFSAFSNIFRYKLLLEQGGWWVDTDVFCLKNDIPKCSYAWAREDQDRINGAILKFPAGDPTLKVILNDALKIGKNIEVWGELGPLLLTKHLAGREFIDHYGDTSTFYPIHWLETYLFWMPDGRNVVSSRCENSAFIHFWDSCFKEFGIDQRLPVPEGSFMNHILEKSGLFQTLSPQDITAQQETLALINAHLSKHWVKTRMKRLLGYEVSSTIM